MHLISMETSELLLLCLSSGGFWGFVLLHSHPLGGPPLTVLPGFTLLLDFGCLLGFNNVSSPQHPKHFHFFFFTVTVHQFFPLLLSSLSPRSPIICISLTPPLSCQLNAPTWSLLCCGGPQKRTGQMVSDDFRALLISTGNSLVLLLA